MKKEPSLELSEELRKLDYDIEFWESADDSNPVGLLKPPSTKASRLIGILNETD